MEIVVGIGHQPTEPFAALGAMREQLDTGMTKDISDHHEGYGDT